MSVSAWFHHHHELPRERGVTDAMLAIADQLEQEKLARLQARFRPETSEPTIHIMDGWLMDDLLQAADVEVIPPQNPLAK
jgi:hypothetical protein